MLTDHVGAISSRGEVDSCSSTSLNCLSKKNDFSKEVVDVRSTAEQPKLDKEIELTKLQIKLVGLNIKLAKLKKEGDPTAWSANPAVQGGEERLSGYERLKREWPECVRCVEASPFPHSGW